MPSDYEGFYVQREAEGGVIEAISGASVEVYDCGAETDIDTLVSDSNGFVAPGTLAVDAGTRVRFRVENHEGLAGSVTQLTT